jgi:2-polyprenyl-6-methoxyphenol hydroxylase-like FAD-dependent oxidoreductase
MEQALFLRSFHPLYLASIHPGGRFGFFGMQHAPELDHPETWTFFFYISWSYTLQEQDRTESWTNAQRLQQAKELAKDFTEPWKSAFAWLPDDHIVWYMGFGDWDPGADEHRWDNHSGRVTLAGDAAHTMTYQRGQGLNHSISDSAKLLSAYKKTKEDPKTTLEDAIVEYEKEMISRAGEEVRMSTTNTTMVHDWQQVLQSPVLTKGLKKS